MIPLQQTSDSNISLDLNEVSFGSGTESFDCNLSQKLTAKALQRKDTIIQRKDTIIHNLRKQLKQRACEKIANPAHLNLQNAVSVTSIMPPLTQSTNSVIMSTEGIAEHRRHCWLSLAGSLSRRLSLVCSLPPALSWRLCPADSLIHGRLSQTFTKQPGQEGGGGRDFIRGPRPRTATQDTWIVYEWLRSKEKRYSGWHRHLFFSSKVSQYWSRFSCGSKAELQQKSLYFKSYAGVSQ